MITFKQYLNEAPEYKSSRLQPKTVDEAIALMRENCLGYLNNLNNQGFIYRGGSGKGSHAISLGDSNTSTPRVSANAQNYYTLWMDNHPDWAKFPKRSQSFICSEDSDTAFDFGDLFLVIPYDDAHIEIVPADDLWSAIIIPKKNSLSYSGSLRDFVENIHDLFTALRRPSPKTYEDLVQALKGITYEDIDDDSGKSHMRAIKKVMDRTASLNLYQAFKEIINPTRFTQLRARQYSNTGNGYELAIQGKAIFIPADNETLSKFADFFKELNIKPPHNV